MGDKRTFVLTVEGAGPTAPAECVGLGVSLTVMLWGHSQYWLEDHRGGGHTRRTRYLCRSRKVDRQYKSTDLLNKPWVEQTFRLEREEQSSQHAFKIVRQSMLISQPARITTSNLIPVHPSHSPPKSFHLKLLCSPDPSNS